jgi:hydrogenase maturation protease
MSELTAAPFLILGIGNELLGDDGAGVVAARHLASCAIPDVDVADGGTLGLMLMPYIAGREAVLVLDAVSQAHGEPGQVVVLSDGQVRQGHGVRVSAHEVGLVDALSAARLAGCAPARVGLVGVVPASITEHWGLSPVVAASIGAMVAAAHGVLASWGVKVPDGA